MCDSLTKPPTVPVEKSVRQQAEAISDYLLTYSDDREKACRLVMEFKDREELNGPGWDRVGLVRAIEVILKR